MLKKSHFNHSHKKQTVSYDYASTELKKISAFQPLHFQHEFLAVCFLAFWLLTIKRINFFQKTSFEKCPCFVKLQAFIRTPSTNTCTNSFYKNSFYRNHKAKILSYTHPVKIYMVKDDNRNTSRLTIKNTRATPMTFLVFLLLTFNILAPFSSVSILTFEQVNINWAGSRLRISQRFFFYKLVQECFCHVLRKRLFIYLFIYLFNSLFRLEF